MSEERKEEQIKQHAAQHAGRRATSEEQRANYLEEVDAVMRAIQLNHAWWEHREDEHGINLVDGHVQVGSGIAAIYRVEDNPKSGYYRFLVQFDQNRKTGKKPADRIMVITCDTWRIVHYSKANNAEKSVAVAPSMSCKQQYTQYRDRTELY